MDNGYEGFVLEGARDSKVPPKIRNTDRWHVELDMDVLSPAMVKAKKVPII